MEIGVLGPLLVEQVEAYRLLPPSKPRQVLALLALNAGSLVTVTAIVRELWGDAPPRSWATTVQTYVMQVRRLLVTVLGPGSDAKQLLVTRAPGYLLRLDPERLDLTRFERRAAEGRAALQLGEDDARAARLLSDALQLWRGPALADLGAGPLLEVQVRRLTERRLATLGLWIEAELNLGHHREMVGELTALVAQHPLDEHFHAQLMLALYRAGRKSEALSAFHRLREMLVGDLGLEPSAQVRRLQEAILGCDPALDAPDPRRELLDRFAG